MGEWTPLYITLAIIFVVGGFVPAIIGGFVEEGQYNQQSYIVPFRNLVDNGITIDLPFISAFKLNPFAWLGTSIKDFLVGQLDAFSYIPNAISIPLIIFCVVGLFYSFIKLLPTT